MMMADQLKHLHRLTAITAADVVLEHRREARPAFRVQVRLEVAGPGPHAKVTRHTRQAALLIHGPALHAEARSNTLEAALLRATQDLEHQVQARNSGAKNGAKANCNSAPFPAGGLRLRPVKGLEDPGLVASCPRPFSYLTNEESNEFWSHEYQQNEKPLDRWAFHRASG